MSLTGRTFSWAFATMVIAELLAITVFFSPSWRTGVFIAGIVVFLVVSIRRLDIAFLILVGELVVGSQGHLFDLTVYGVTVSLRIALFSIIFILWLFRRIKAKNFPFRTSHFFRWVVAFLAVVAIGIIIGLLHGNGVKNIYLDANAFLFLLLAPLILEQLAHRSQISRVLQIMFAGVVLLALQSLVLLAIFSHGSAYVPEVYRWVRDSRLYEINRIAANFFRTFSQAQFFSLPALALILLAVVQKNVISARWARFLFGLAAMIVAMMSFSRSFWVALAVVGAVALPLVTRHFRLSGKYVVKLLAGTVVLAALSLIIISFTANAPYLWNRPGGQHTLALLEDRSTDTKEAAAGSRYALLKPLTKAALLHPIIGSGFGTTVTYTTRDPHFVEVAGGSRTTFAFEWGYLDLWLKTGLLGVVVVLGFIFSVVRTLRKAFRISPSEQWLTLAIILSVFMLVVTHALTPYLNHPIGLFLLLMAAGVGESILRKPATMPS